MDAEAVEVEMEDIPPGYILIRKEDGLFAFLKMEPEDQDPRVAEAIDDEEAEDEVHIDEVDEEFDREELHVIEDGSQIVMDHLTPVTIEQTVTDDQVEYLDDSLFVAPGEKQFFRQDRKPRASNSVQMWKGVPLPSGLTDEELKLFKTNHLLQRLSDRVKRNRQKVSIYGNKNDNLRKLISNQRVHMVKMGFHVKDISRFHPFFRRPREEVRSPSPEIDKRLLTDLEQMEHEKRQLEKEYDNLRKKLKSLLSSHRRYKKVFVENHEKILKGPKKRTTSDALLKNESYLMQLASESEESDDYGPGNKKEKIFKCYHCNYSAASKADLVPHIEGHLLQKKFECPECPFFTSKITPFLEHMKSHPGAKAFTCKSCDFKSAYPSAMRNHESTHLEVKPFVCPTCGFRTSRSDHLRNHLRKHANDRPYKCTICSFTSKYASGLSKHKKSVHDPNPPQKKRKYNRHKLVKPENESDDAADETTEIELDEEGKMVRIRNIKRSSIVENENHEERRMSLRTNVKKKILADFVDGEEIEEGEEYVKEVFKVEDKDDDYTLEQEEDEMQEEDTAEIENEYESVERGGFNENINDDEDNEEMEDESVNYSEQMKNITAPKDLLSSYVIYQCVFCDFSCEMKSSLLTHLKSHMENWSFSCRSCSFVAVNPLDLQTHSEEHRNVGENACCYCDQIFDSRDKLKRHVAKRHPHGKPLSCVYCDFISSNRLSMKTHMLGHKSKKVWQCLICSYKASFKSGLKRHLRIHTGERPYHCPHCEFNAAQCSHLSRHLKRFHAEESQYADGHPDSPYML